MCDDFKVFKKEVCNSTLALQTHCFMLRIKGVLKRTKWVDLIFEVEKSSIFQLQKSNQPEKKLSMYAFCAQHKTVCLKCQSRSK
jgi:hypothetical protein